MIYRDFKIFKCRKFLNYSDKVKTGDQCLKTAKIYDWRPMFKKLEKLIFGVLKHS